jgi:hypothetical protein
MQSRPYITLQIRPRCLKHDQKLLKLLLKEIEPRCIAEVQVQALELLTVFYSVGQCVQIVISLKFLFEFTVAWKWSLHLENVIEFIEEVVFLD